VVETPIVESMSESTSTAEISPTPTDDEVVAIMAGVEALWPRPAVIATAPMRTTVWRFSGRWWSRPVPARRDRPFR